MMKNRNHSKLQTVFFSENSLVILISIVTLLLQLISFATTWNGSKVYLEGVFPYASLLFAIAIQATAYFFSNSLRTGVRPFKVLALCTAICCSTYYSYIGIYNSVNSPASYLEQSYTCIRRELSQMYEEELTHDLATVREAVNTAASRITADITSLTTAAQNITSCRTALENLDTSYTSGMRAPKLSSYENYEDYAAAYQTYIASVSQGNDTEKNAARNSTLLSYGFTSIDELNIAEQENAARLESLNMALGISNDSAASITDSVSKLTLQLSTAINNAAVGQCPDTTDTIRFNQLFQAAKLCGYEGSELSTLLNTLKQCAEASSSPLLSDYPSLVSALPNGRVTSADTMELKKTMDSEILTALTRINSLLPSKEQLALHDPRFQITDIYLLPVKALQDSDTRMTAFFCLAVAALIDALSVLFAVSLRKKKPLWRRSFLLRTNLEEYAPLIYAALPAGSTPSKALSEFLMHFQPSPHTEADGYMMQADISLLRDYSSLMALLCQANLAKLVPSGFLENKEELLLLKARFVFWANTVIYEERSICTEKELVYE